MKYRAIIEMTYEALNKWLGLPPGVEVRAVTNDSAREIASFHVGSSQEYIKPNEVNLPSTLEGEHSMIRRVDSRQMIEPTLDKTLIFRLGKYRLYRVSDEQTN